MVVIREPEDETRHPRFPPLIVEVSFDVGFSFAQPKAQDKSGRGGKGLAPIDRASGAATVLI